jgi:hypothetical protein
MDKENFYDLIDDLVYYNIEHQLDIINECDELQLKRNRKNIEEIEEKIKTQLDVLYDK